MKLDSLNDLANAISVRNYLDSLTENPNALNKDDYKKALMILKNFNKVILEGILNFDFENASNSKQLETMLKREVPKRNAYPISETQNEKLKQSDLNMNSTVSAPVKQNKKPGSFRRVEDLENRYMIGHPPVSNASEIKNEDSEKSE